MPTRNKKRKYLTQQELNRVLEQAKLARNGTRDYCLYLIAFRHGLRVSEICNLQWSDIDFDRPAIYLNRLKGSIAGWHTLLDDEVNAIVKCIEFYNENNIASKYVFCSTHSDSKDRKLSDDGIRSLLKTLSRKLGLDYTINPHTFKHTCGFNLAANDINPVKIKEYLGHRDIKNTMVYINDAGNQFSDIEKLWKSK